jgi:hypothetical protein
MFGVLFLSKARPAAGAEAGGNGRRSIMANVVCPDCGGEKGGLRISCGSRGCQSSTFVCDFCKGEGQVSPEANALWQKGRELRTARVKRGLTQQQEARILGIDWIDLNDVELGRLALEGAPHVHYDPTE